MVGEADFRHTNADVSHSVVGQTTLGIIEEF